MFEWDAAKAAENLDKHGIDFADAATIFEDLYAITIEDRRHDEPRFVSIGLDAQLRILVVVYTHREQNIRIISARKANKSERRHYEEK